MGYFLRARVEENDIFDALLQIKWGADLGIFLLIILTQNFEDCLRDFLKRLILIRRLLTKNRNIRTLKRAIWKLNVGVGDLEAPTIRTLRSLKAKENPKNLFLVSRSWERLPRGNTARDLQLDAGFVRHLH